MSLCRVRECFSAVGCVHKQGTHLMTISKSWQCKFSVGSMEEVLALGMRFAPHTRLAGINSISSLRTTVISISSTECMHL